VLQGYLGGLPTFLHGGSLKTQWDPFESALDNLLCTLQSSNNSESNVAANLLSSVRRRLEPVRNRVNDLCASQDLLRERFIGRVSRHEGFNLGELLDRIADAWEVSVPDLRIHRDWEIAAGLTLNCDEYLVSNVLRCLMENALAAGQERNAASVEIWIRANVEPWTGKRTGGFVAIRVTDSGFGVPQEARDYLFIDGFTFRPNADLQRDTASGTHRHTGRGLSLARMLAAGCRGDVQFEDRGPSLHPQTRNATLGATFIFRIAVEHLAVAATEGRLV
jgi:signal transduction histidine kinase